jgi:hypothetical protein
MLENRFKLGVMVLTAIGVMVMFTGCSSTRERPYTLEELQMIERVQTIQINNNLIRQQHLGQAADSFHKVERSLNNLRDQFTGAAYRGNSTTSTCTKFGNSYECTND